MDKIQKLMNSPERIASFKKRFELYTQRSESGCLEWTGTLNADGYGVVSCGRKLNKFRVHRIIKSLEIGESAGSKCVLHKCDNPKCVDPDHLFLGSKLDNTHDMIAKGRMSPPPIHKGEAHHHATISDEQVRFIRADSRTLASLAKIYGVSAKTIWRIKKRKTRAEA